MNTKEKAKEFVEKYLNTIIHSPYIDKEDDNCIGTGYMTHNSAVRCAIIAVDEILKNFEGMHKPEYCSFDAIGKRKFTFESEYPEHMTGYDMVAYWNDVKVQIEAL